MTRNHILAGTLLMSGLFSSFAGGSSENPELRSLVSFHPDGRHLVAATGNGAVIIYRNDSVVERLNGWKPARVLHQEGVHMFAGYSRDGRYLVTSGQIVSHPEDSTFRVRDSSVGELVSIGGGFQAQRIVISHDSRHLAYPDITGIAIWDIPENRHLLRGSQISFPEEIGLGLCFLREAPVLIIGTRPGSLIALNFLDSTFTLHEGISDGLITSIAVHHDNTILAVANYAGDIALWEYSLEPETEFALIWRRSVHSGSVNSLSFDTAGEKLGAASVDGSVSSWDVDTGEKIGGFTLEEPIELDNMGGTVAGFNSVSIHPSGSIAAVSAVDNSIRLINFDGETPQSHLLPTTVVTTVTRGPAGTYAYGYANGVVRIVLAGGKTSLFAYSHFHGAVTHLAFSPDEPLVYVAYADGRIARWDLQSRSIVYANETDYIHQMIRSPIDPLIATIESHYSSSNYIGLRDAETFRELRSSRPSNERGYDTARFSQVLFHPKKPMLIGCDTIGNVILFNTNDFDDRPSYRLPAGISALQISDDGKLLACGMQDGSLAVLLVGDSRAPIPLWFVKGSDSPIVSIIVEGRYVDDMSDPISVEAVDAIGNAYRWETITEGRSVRFSAAAKEERDPRSTITRFDPQGGIYDAETSRTVEQYRAVVVERSEKMDAHPLFAAIDVKDYREVLRLLQDGTDPNIRNSWLRSPLLMAVYGYSSSDKRPRIVELLLEYNADPNLSDLDAVAPLNAATQYGKYDIVELLLKHGADPNHKARRGDTPLYFAASKPAPDLVKLLLNAGADPDLSAVTESPREMAERLGKNDILELFAR